MAINYTNAYKYKNNKEKLTELFTRAFNHYQDKQYPLVYYPSGLKIYDSIFTTGRIWYEGLGFLFNPDSGVTLSGAEVQTPCIYQYTAVDLSNYKTLKFYPYSVKPYTVGTATTPQVGSVGISSTVEQLMTSGFDTVITDISYYDNTYDGTYSTSNPRIKYTGTRTLGAYMTAPQTQRYVNGMPEIFTVGYEFFLNLNLFAKAYGAVGYGSYPVPSSIYAAWLLTNVYDQYGYYYGAVNSDATVTLDGSGFVSAWSGVTSGFSGFLCNRKKFTELLNTVGIPFSFSPDCKYQNTEDFDDYVPSGQPSNPTDDGGDPYGDNSSDDMELPDVQVSPTNTFSRLSCCTISELNKLSNFLFTSTFYDNIKLLTNDPLESLCTVMYYPFDVLNHSTCGGAHNLTLTNVSTPATVYDLDVLYNMCLDMGHIDVNPYYGSYLDYSPNTEIELYLPYRGFVNLPTNDIIGRQLSVKYMIDFYSGSATILVFADTKLVHVSNAQVGINIPISQSNANSRAISLTTAAVGAVGAIAGGAIGGAAGGLAGAAIGAGQAAGTNAIPTVNRMFNAAQNHVDKGGSFGGVGWLYAPQVCSLIYNRPILAEPKAYKTMNGYSTSFSGLVSSYSGFLQADSISGTTGATDEENNMILNLLRNGIYV